MFWMVFAFLVFFSLGCAAMKRYPQDEFLGALAQGASAPFLFVHQTINRVKTPTTEMELAGELPTPQKKEK